VADALHQLRVPGGGHGDANREAGRSQPAGEAPSAPGAVGTIGHFDGWDAQPFHGRGVPHRRASEHGHLLFDGHLTEQFFDPFCHAFLVFSE